MLTIIAEYIPASQQSPQYTNPRFARTWGAAGQRGLRPHLDSPGAARLMGLGAQAHLPHKCQSESQATRPKTQAGPDAT